MPIISSPLSNPISGKGYREDTYEFSEVRVRGTTQDAGEELPDIGPIVRRAHVQASIVGDDGTHYSVTNASPREAAQILDAIFRSTFIAQPFPDVDDDYAMGAGPRRAPRGNPLGGRPQG